MASSADSPSGDAASKIPATESYQCLTLPNELLSMIAHECDPSDLKNMRLASRLFHQISTGLFACKYFSRRRFIFTYQSMKALVDITAHPTFGPHLTCITFGTYRLMEDLWLEFYREKSPEWLARYRATEAVYRDFIKRHHHVKMLILALKNLRKCQNTRVILGIHDDYHRGEYRRRGYAFKASYQDLDDLQCDADAAMKAVTTAWQRSGYPLTALKFCLSDESDSLEALALESNSVLDLILPNGSSRFTTALDLHINVWQEEGSYANLKLLSKFTRLELSRHHIGNRVGGSSLIGFDELYYERIWEAIMLSPLKSISIACSDTEYHELVQMLQFHKNSLRMLKLRQVRMPVWESAKDFTLGFLRFLKDHLKLTYLLMEDIFVENVYSLETSITLPGSDEGLVCDGREAIDEGLERLIEGAKQGYHDEGLESSAEESGRESGDD
ncbi:hypothetical protein E4T50_11014 [Aureobasidium sp. EXF-12298]|nr:hypothetical protein E4T50_11014 [Aureobasidium sp. EXF-12298]